MTHVSLISGVPHIAGTKRSWWWLLLGFPLFCLHVVTNIFHLPQGLIRIRWPITILILSLQRSLYGENARKLPERTNEMAGVYAGQCIELAREMHIPCVNIWSKMQETEGWQTLYLR